MTAGSENTRKAPSEGRFSVWQVNLPHWGGVGGGLNVYTKIAMSRDHKLSEPRPPLLSDLSPFVLSCIQGDCCVHICPH